MVHSYQIHKLVNCHIKPGEFIKTAHLFGTRQCCTEMNTELWVWQKMHGKEHRANSTHQYGVPTKELAGEAIEAEPKSASLTWPGLVSRIFPALMSLLYCTRWTHFSS